VKAVVIWHECLADKTNTKTMSFKVVVEAWSFGLTFHAH
jgi:hypothetical protein